MYRVYLFIVLQKVRDMPLDDVVILDIDKHEIEMTGDCLDDVDNLPPEAVRKQNLMIQGYLSPTIAHTVNFKELN